MTESKKIDSENLDISFRELLEGNSHLLGEAVNTVLASNDIQGWCAEDYLPYGVIGDKGQPLQAFFSIPESYDGHKLAKRLMVSFIPRINVKEKPFKVGFEVESIYGCREEQTSWYTYCGNNEYLFVFQIYSAGKAKERPIFEVNAA